MTSYRNCQSCGMPLARDEMGGGSKRDGSRSTMYCSHCYADGAFVQPDMTLEQMQHKVRQKVAEFGIPAFLAGFFTHGVPRLERWKNGNSQHTVERRGDETNGMPN